MYLRTIVTFATLPLLVLAISEFAGMPITLNKRSNLWNLDGSVNLGAVRAHIFKTSWKIQQGYAAYKKNTGVIPLTDYQNVWYGNISIGSPASVSTVDFDSAGDFFIVAGPGSTCDGHNEYNPELSSTSKNFNETFTSQLFGANLTISGDKYSDTVTMGGYTVKTQNISVVKEYASAFCQINYTPHNFIGLAFKGTPGIPVQSDTPIIEALVTEGVLPRPIFSVLLGSYGSGELRLGAVNHKLYKGHFTYTPVIADGFWEVDVDSINVNGKRIISGAFGLIDTATTVILANASSVSQFYSAINGTDVGGGLYTLPCDNMPTVSVTLGGATFTLSEDTFNLGPYSSSGKACVGAISAHDGVGDVWVLGDTFLRNVYTVFDVGNARVGYAHLA